MLVRSAKLGNLIKTVRGFPGETLPEFSIRNVETIGGVICIFSLCKFRTLFWVY